MSFFPKIIALDLDGTLLDSEKRISPANYAALAAAAACGALVVPATGRFFRMMPAAVRDLPFVRYAITCNGAEVFDRVRDEAVVREDIPLETALGVMRILDRHDLIYDCYMDGWGWMTKSMQERASDYVADRHYIQVIRDYRTPVPELKAHIASVGHGVQKIMAFARDPGVFDRVRGDLEKEFGDLALSSATWNNFEVNAPAATKGAALLSLAKHLGVDPADTLAFGDASNDLPMIRAAGIGVAMANASADICAAADRVAPTNDESGVAAVVNELLGIRHMKLVSYNIRHGQGVDGALDIPRIARIIAREQPDFAGIQEVDVRTSRVRGLDEAAELGRLTGMHPVFGRAIDYANGEYGVLLLAREAPLSVLRLPLPGAEPRLLLLAEFSDCWFGTTHLAVDSERARMDSIAGIRDAVQGRKKPVFLTGDWNAGPDSTTLRGLGEFLTLLSDTSARTYHGKGDSSLCIDYIAVDAAHAADVLVEEFHVVEERVASDHAPIVASVALLPR